MQAKKSIIAKKEKAYFKRPITGPENLGFSMQDQRRRRYSVVNTNKENSSKARSQSPYRL
jgi:hypothetical protein